MSINIQDIFKENMKAIKGRIVTWWNDNQLLDEEIDKVKDINGVLRKHKLDTVKNAIYYHESTGKTISYSKEVKKDFSIVGPDFVDVILLIEKKKKEII